MSKPIVRAAEWDAGKGLWRKRMLWRNVMDRDFKVIPRESGQTSTG